MKFVDEVQISVRAGKGGDGCIAWRREKYIPRGGPAGGDGGDGGHVIIKADPQLGTLLDYRYAREHRAEDGERGQNKDKNGRRGKDIILRAPVGTLVYDEETGELLADLSQPGQEIIAARGGRGGRGNIHFATSTNRAPERAEPGTPGEERRLRLELKLLADVGILGFPNVGKSTFIARVSHARPKIADYPFTTLVPNLGVISWRDFRSFVIADIPGLIPGASEGAGLGLRFLRHIERTRVLLHLLEVSEEPGREPLRDFTVINQELAQYNPDLAQRPQVVALNKIDLPHVRDLFPSLAAHFRAQNIPFYGISAVTGEGVTEVIDHLGGMLWGNSGRKE